jgi:peptidyl-tRNA hydrolase
MAVVQYIVLRRDLIDEYGKGFLATQAAHASLAPLTSQLRGHFHKTLSEALDKDTREWIEGTFTKIVLEVQGINQLQEISESLRRDSVKYCEIRESTLQNELTGIGLRPYEKSKVASYFKRLNLLS